jgi:hypothetical protein
MKYWKEAMVLSIITAAGSAFATMEPLWMFTNRHPVIFNYFRYCDTNRDVDVLCRALESDQLPDSGDAYDSTYINLDYQFNHDSVIVRDPYDPSVIIYQDASLRPGFAGFKTAWDYGMNGFPFPRYKYLILAHKGPLSTHKVTIRVWYNDGSCGSPSFNEFIGTLTASSTWVLDTIPIPDTIRNKPDFARNNYKYYELVFIINNITPGDTTSGPPGNFKVDEIRLAGCNPIDSSPKAQSVTEGDPAVFTVSTTRAELNDVLSFQWKKDGTDIPGATDSVYTVASATPGDAGVYTVAVTVSSTSLTFTSWGALLTVTAATTEKEGCGCGSGTGAALIPPLFFKVMAHRKRKKRSIK